MRLLGVFERNSEEHLLLQEKNMIFIKSKNETNETFGNYEFLKNRDKYIGNGKTEGEGVFNFRYGPVTGGVADAGVFNIYTYGERILSVNIDPSYKKRNVEQLMNHRRFASAINLSEKICSTLAFSHSTAFLRAIEDAINIEADEFTKRIRVIGVELERIYNHLHVITRLSKGASQNVLTSHLEGLFEEALRTNKIFSGSRFLCNLNSLSIDSKKIDKTTLNEVLSKVTFIKSKFEELYEHSLESWNFIDRIYKTAILDKKKAIDIGITGPSLRASGVAEDLRIFEKSYNNFNIITKESSDSLARMQVRAEEVIQSCDIIKNQIEFIDKLDTNNGKEIDDKIISGLGIGYCESPSGLVVYFVDLKKGNLEDVYISTPSVFGFKAFAESFIGYIFTDFSFSFDSFGINFADCAR